jgi:hypothetical protein
MVALVDYKKDAPNRQGCLPGPVRAAGAVGMRSALLLRCVPLAALKDVGRDGLLIMQWTCYLQARARLQSLATMRRSATGWKLPWGRQPDYGEADGGAILHGRHWCEPWAPKVGPRRGIIAITIMIIFKCLLGQTKLILG